MCNLSSSITVKLTKKQNKKMNELATRYNLSKAEYIRNCITITSNASIKKSELEPYIKELTELIYSNNIYDDNYSVIKHLTVLNDLLCKDSLNSYRCYNKKFSKKINVPVSNEQKKHIKTQAYENAMSVSEYARMVLFSNNEVVSKTALLPILEELNYSIKKVSLYCIHTSKEQEVIYKIWKLFF